MKTSDDQLVKRITGFNDEKAFDALFVKYYPGLLHYSKVLLPYPTDEAEDMIAEVFLKIWQQRATLVIHSSVASYLYIALKNRIHDYYRKNGMFSFESLDVLDHTSSTDQLPDQQLFYKELNQVIGQLIEQLPARTQLVFKMNRNDHMTYDEIALILDLSLNSVKTHMYRALKSLKEGYKASNRTV